MLHLISANVRPEGSGLDYVTFVFGSRDNEVRNHNQNLVAQGYEVLDVKVEPWYDGGMYAPDAAYEADETPGFGELTNDTDQAEQG